MAAVSACRTPIGSLAAAERPHRCGLARGEAIARAKDARRHRRRDSVASFRRALECSPVRQRIKSKFPRFQLRKRSRVCGSGLQAVAHAVEALHMGYGGRRRGGRHSNSCQCPISAERRAIRTGQHTRKVTDVMFWTKGSRAP